MTCVANQITVSMWNATLDWNGLRKSESFMTVIIKVNLIQIGPFQDSKAQGTKKAYLLIGVREMRLGKRVWKRLRILKLSTSWIKFHWSQQLILHISKVTDI